MSESVDNSYIAPMPRTALQAIYHAVTGKTETYSKNLDGSVLITHNCIEQLYQRIQQQLAHYELVAPPTITVNVKTSDNRTLQYSSWERYREFSANSAEITSDVAIKLEFLTQLPNTATPQRCILNVSLDSGMPIILHRKAGGVPELIMLELLPFWGENYPTVKISIDFVDFLIAKIFCGVVEEWFQTLEPVHCSKFMICLTRNVSAIRAIISQFGRVGSAAFLAGYVWFSGGAIGNIGRLAYAAAIALCTWAVIAVATTFLNRITADRILSNVMPSVLLLTDSDKKAYKTIYEKQASASKTLGSIVIVGICNIVLNVMASFIFVWLTMHPSGAR